MTLLDYLMSLDAGSVERCQAKLTTGYEVVLNVDTGYYELDKL